MKAALVAVCLLSVGLGAEANESRSGYHYQSDEIQTLQDDEFANPGMLWVDRGRELFGQDDGPTACASCHEPADLVGSATRFPQVRGGEIVNLEGQINQCREERQAASAYAYESDELLALTTYIAHLSLGMPMVFDLKEADQALLDEAATLYRSRRGQLNLACHHCHDQNVGRMLRGDRLSQGQSVGYPIYRLDWQTQGSLHRRLRTCLEGVRSETYPLGSRNYLLLELYLASRARGLLMEAPAVRR